jgi:hypothetical protein
MADALERVLDELTAMTIKEMRDAIRDARQASAQVVEVGLAKETDVSGGADDRRSHPPARQDLVGA